MELLLVRHGQPEWVRDGLNVVDPPLTELGHRQAAALAQTMVSEALDEVLVSPLLRARQTAAPVLEALGRSEDIDMWLEEIRDPKWHGTPAERAAEAYAELRDRAPADRWRGLTGGEDIREFVDRIHLGAEKFLQERGVHRLDLALPVWHITDPGRRIALIAHAGTNTIVICHLLGLEPTPWEWDRMVLRHASISRLEAIPAGEGYIFSLTALSDVEHLAAADRTSSTWRPLTGPASRAAYVAGMSLDADALKQFQFLVFMKLEGAITSGMIHLGDKLGLYRAIADGGPMTTGELATATGLDERWLREWAHNQAAAKLLTVSGDGTDERFTMTPEAAAVLASPDHEAFGMGMFHRLPQTMATLRELPEMFRTGLGQDYDSHGPEGAVGIERSFEPWNRAHLLPDVVPAMDGMADRLDAGARVADVGCGAGGAVLLLAGAFPASTFTGYDISQYALARANERLTETGLTNATFADPREAPLPSDRSLDLVTTFDCIHDMTDPQGMMHTIRDAVRDDGTWLLVDIKARDTFEENVAKNPMASLMYGISVFSCMSSALSRPGGAGLGTLGLSASKAEAMAREAGFTQFRKLPVDHAVNAFYEVRP